MPYNSNHFQHIENILRTSVDNLILQIPLKCQVDRIKIVQVLLLVVLKNAVLRKIAFKSFKSAYLLIWGIRRGRL